MSRYRAIQLQRFADSFREGCDVVDLPVVAPAAGELRVRNLYCGVNAIFDTQITRNAVDYVRIPVPSFTGVEALGTVAAIGDGVTGFTVGDPVVTTRFGRGYREQAIGPAGDFTPVPQASPAMLALASTGVSALLALEHIGQVSDGETVAISAAAGGLGHLLVQLAKLRGCTVIAIAGGATKGDFLRDLGADRVIDYRSEDVAAILRAEFPRGIDVAVDTVSGAIFDAFLANMAPHGRLVVAGAAADLNGKPEIVTQPRIAHSIYYKGVSVRGFMNGILTEHWPAAREKLFALHAAGRIAVTRDAHEFEGITSIYDAVEWLLSGRSMGKVMVNL